jgi:hypothetical protein
MNAGGDEFFASTAFADNQHRPVQLRDTGNPLEDFEKNRRFTDQWLLLQAFHQSSSFVKHAVIVRKMD